MVPLGLRIPIGVVAGRRLRTWASTVQKWDVQPLSAIAIEEELETMGAGDLALRRHNSKNRNH